MPAKGLMLCSFRHRCERFFACFGLMAAEETGLDMRRRAMLHRQPSRLGRLLLRKMGV